MTAQCLTDYCINKPHHEQYNQKSIDGVDDIVCQVMARRRPAPYRIIQGMGYPCERVPVVGVEVKKGPPQKNQIERKDIGIVKKILPVIPVDEVISERRKIYQEFKRRD